MFRLPRLGAGVAACVLPLATLAAQPQPNPDLELAHHVLRRVTFGPTPDLVHRIVNHPNTPSAMDEVLMFLDEQLNPPPRSSGPLAYHGHPLVRDLVAPGGPLGVLQTPPAVSMSAFYANIDATSSSAQANGSELAHGLASEWQLREVMCQFWERHFNTHLIGSQFWFFQKIPQGYDNGAFAWHYEFRANEFYREHALGSFRDLLGFTSKHVTMIAYLHLDLNTAAGPNEDYARELLELYTMGPETPQPAGGPTANYSQQDVETVATILTGWNVDPAQDFAFQFVPADHDFTSSRAPLFPAGITMEIDVIGQGEGEWLLDTLAGLDATKDFLCRKLIDEFLGDGAWQQEQTLLQDMKSKWGSEGDIQAVLEELLTSAAFLTGPYRWERARLPLETVLAFPRAFGSQIRTVTVGNPPVAVPTIECLFGAYAGLETLGQSLHNYPAPNGYPLASDAQHSPHAALARLAYAANSQFWAAGPNGNLSPPSPLAPDCDIAAQVAQALPSGWNNPLLVARFLLERLYGTRFTADDELRVALAIFDAANFIGASGGVTPTSPEFSFNVRAGAVTAMAMSQGALR